jgi:hypothetical protein
VVGGGTDLRGGESVPGFAVGHRAAGGLCARTAGQPHGRSVAGERKTDAKDARTIAENTRIRDDLIVITSLDQIVSDLWVLTARRAGLMADWVRAVNRLHELLASIFSALERAFDYSTRR